MSDLKERLKRIVGTTQTYGSAETIEISVGTFREALARITELEEVSASLEKAVEDAERMRRALEEIAKRTAVYRSLAEKRDPLEDDNLNRHDLYVFAVEVSEITEGIARAALQPEGGGK
jgi:DNA-directed RNA polymerase alpha subunit